MLVLSRKKNETCVLLINGVEVRCVVVEIRGDKVRLGWEAPPEVAIHRREVIDAIRRQQPERVFKVQGDPNAVRPV